MNLSIYSMMIEVTRQCNLECDHCIRGEAENKRFNPEHLEQFLTYHNVEISTLCFTGGEPTLATNILIEILAILRRTQTSVGSFWMAINGTQVPDKFFMFCADMYTYCDEDVEDGMFGVEVSNSDWHYNRNRKDIDKLMALRFAKRREYIDGQSLVNEGRAVDIEDYSYRKTEPHISLEIDEREDNVNIGDEFYINAEGFLVPSCDLSYKSQEDYKICHITDPELVDKIHAFQEDELVG